MTIKIDTKKIIPTIESKKLFNAKFLIHGYRYCMTKHLFTFRDKSRKLRLTISEDAIVDVLQYAFKYSTLADGNINYEKRALIFPSRDKKYFIGLLIVIEDHIVTVISMYDVPVEFYKKIGLYAKEKKIMLDDYDLDSFLSEEEAKEKAYLAGYEKRYKVGVYKHESYRDYIKSRIVRAEKNEKQLSKIRVIKRAKEKKKALYSSILISMMKNKKNLK